MADDVHRGMVARITTARARGAGFVIREGLVATALHVVAKRGTHR
jgi:S1-C subfamily serine protease